MHQSPPNPDEIQRLEEEIRGSLDAIIGMSALLLHEGLTDAQARCARTIEARARGLLPLVGRLFAPPAPEPAAGPALPEARPLRFLVAEDNTINRIVLADQLEQLGHSSVSVANGRETLAAIENASWDALLLDCQMPVMDGYETIAAIRRREAGGAPRTWVVAVTASALAGERETCLRAGMDDFLTKPLHIQDLAGAIARIPLPEGAGRAIDPGQLASLAESKAVNGENLLARMASLFTESGPQLLDQMDEGLRRDDVAATLRAAHKLAGGCGYFGAKDLHNLCVAAERLGHLGDHAGVRGLVPRIRQEYARVALALERNRPQP